MSKESIPIEIELRGIVLKLAVNIEGVLMNIIYTSSKKLYSDKKLFKFFKLRGCMFSQKIDRVEKVLRLFHKDLLDNNAKLFEDLREFKKIRNRFAHCNIYWKESVDNFEIWDIVDVDVDVDDKFEFYQPFEYSVIETRNILAKANIDIFIPLVALFREVQRRLQIDSPKLYAKLILGKEVP